MLFRMMVIAVFLGLILGCSDGIDEVNDDDILTGIGREAVCVASAERLQLYDIAKKHRRHGERSETKYLRALNGKDEDRFFEKKVGEARTVYADMSKMFHAMYLTNACGEKIRMDYIESIN